MPNNQYLVRLISSNDHDLTKDELVKLVQETGSDRYDAKRTQQFDEFYAQHSVDFFAELTDSAVFDAKIAQMVAEFPEKTKGDREKSVEPDIAIIYDAAQCKMIEDVYPGQHESDCFQFIGNPKDALVEVRSL